MAVNSSQSIAFASLSEKIRDWLSSEEIADIIEKICRKAKIEGEKVKWLSKIILRIAVQTLDPRQLSDEINKQLGIGADSAKKLAAEIKEKALRPIERDLKAMGIDIDMITDFASPSPKMEPPPPENLPLAVKKQVFLPPSDRPFVIHEEEAVKTEISENRPSLIYKVPLQEKEVGGPQVKAEIEGLMRVVHYSNFFSPLNQANIQDAVKEQKVFVPKSKWFV